MSTMKGVWTHALAMLGVVLALSVAGLPLAESQRQYDAGLNFPHSRGLTAGTLSFHKGSFSAKCAWAVAVVGHAFQPRSRIGGRQNKLHSSLFEQATAGIKSVHHDLLTANRSWFRFLLPLNRNLMKHHKHVVMPGTLNLMAVLRQNLTRF